MLAFVPQNGLTPCFCWSLQGAQGCTEGQKDTLQSYVARVMGKMPGKILALQVVGVENYFRLNIFPSKCFCVVSGLAKYHRGLH